MNKYHKIQIRTNELLSRGSSTDLQSRLVDIFLFILILLNVTAVCLESVKSIRDSFGYEFFIFELPIDLYMDHILAPTPVFNIAYNSIIRCIVNLFVSA